jgi:polar amino acid transport system substrate-binding protein
MKSKRTADEQVMSMWKSKYLLHFSIFVSCSSVAMAAEIPIRIVTENYPPYEMQKPLNGLQGFDYEVAVEAFSRMGYVADIRFLPWKRALNEAENGSTVGILTCAYEANRERFILYSNPISTFSEGLFLRRGHKGPDIRVLSDVIGHPVASMAGYESLKDLQGIGADPAEVPTTDDGLLMLRAGRFDYLHAAREPTEFLIREKGIQDEFQFIALEDDSFYFCFSKAYPEVENLASEFNEALRSMRKDGSYDAIHSKYR